MQLREKIRLLRGRRSQAEFGALIGADQSTVSKWERGLQEPSTECLIALAALAAQSTESFMHSPELPLLEGAVLLTPPSRPEGDDGSIDTALLAAAMAKVEEVLSQLPREVADRFRHKMSSELYDHMARERARKALPRSGK